MISSLTVFTSSQDGLALAPAGAVVVDEHDEVSGANEGFFVWDAFMAVSYTHLTLPTNSLV